MNLYTNSRFLEIVCYLCNKGSKSILFQNATYSRQTNLNQETIVLKPLKIGTNYKACKGKIRADLKECGALQSTRHETVFKYKISNLSTPIMTSFTTQKILILEL